MAAWDEPDRARETWLRSCRAQAQSWLEQSLPDLGQRCRAKAGAALEEVLEAETHRRGPWDPEAFQDHLRERIRQAISANSSVSWPPTRTPRTSSGSPTASVQPTIGSWNVSPRRAASAPGFRGWWRISPGAWRPREKGHLEPAAGAGSPGWPEPTPAWPARPRNG
jgi:hypothetical protein